MFCPEKRGTRKSALSSGKENMASKVAKRKTGKKPRKNTWKENEVFLFATVLSSLEGREVRSELSGPYSENFSSEEDCQRKYF